MENLFMADLEMEPYQSQVEGTWSNSGNNVSEESQQNAGLIGKRVDHTRLNGWPMHSPTDGSPPPSRMPAHASGPTWIASPSSWRTSTAYSLSVHAGAPQN
jgi:hypothetical protein